MNGRAAGQWWIVGVACWLIGNSSILLAGTGPEQVVLVVNQNHATSLLIANHYAAWRRIPARNVIYLDQVPSTTVISLEQFKARILNPIFDAVRDRGLSHQIDAIVYSDGFPTAVNITPHIRLWETQLRGQNQGEFELGRLYNPRASLTSLTYFASAVLTDEPGYLSPDANWYYRGPAFKLITDPFLGEEQELYQRGLSALAAEKYDQALEAFDTLLTRHPQQIAAVYQMARVYAAMDDAEMASMWMSRAVQTGWMYRPVVQRDPIFAAVLKDDRFRRIVDQMGNESLEFTPTHAFRSTYWWSPTGSINGRPDQGRNFVLSTMLAITGPNGNSEQEALDQLKRSVTADGTRPAGQFLFALTNDVRTTSRQSQFMPTIERLRALGLEAEIISRAIPQRARVAGLSIGTPNFDWRNANSTILPGAICENFTSLGGRFDNAGQTKLTEFLRHGAAGSSGTVIEPYAVTNKFPHTMMHVHYARGCTLAEAYYQSVQGPFQLLIAGDALCQPWARLPVFETSGWVPPPSVSETIVIPLSPKADSVSIVALEIYVDGHFTAVTQWPQHVRFDTAHLTDGYHELRFVAVGPGPIYPRSRIIVPLWIDNQGTEVELSSTRNEIPIADDVHVTFHANVGQRFELRQGARLLGTATSQTGEFSIPAAKLGRGPVQLQLVAIDDDGLEFASRPLSFEIQGPISSVVPQPSPARQNPQPRGRRGGG